MKILPTDGKTLANNVLKKYLGKFYHRWEISSVGLFSASWRIGENFAQRK